MKTLFLLNCYYIIIVILYIIKKKPSCASCCRRIAQLGEKNQKYFFKKTIIMGGLQPKKSEKNSPKFEICGSFRFFSVFYRFLVVLFRFFFRSELQQEIPAIQNHVNNEVLGGQKLPNNTLNAYKALQMSRKSYYNHQELLKTNPLNQSKFATMEKPKKTGKKPEKKQKKPVPNLKFAIAFGFFGLQPPKNRLF